ncbi:MAG: hypothetical protein ACLVK8_04460 [Ruminococcus sp.]
MNIIEAVESLKQGKAIQRTGWGNAKIQAVQLENGQYQILHLVTNAGNVGTAPAIMM